MMLRQDGDLLKAVVLNGHVVGRKPAVAVFAAEAAVRAILQQGRQDFGAAVHAGYVKSGLVTIFWVLPVDRHAVREQVLHALGCVVLDCQL